MRHRVGMRSHVGKRKMLDRGAWRPNALRMSEDSRLLPRSTARSFARLRCAVAAALGAGVLFPMTTYHCIVCKGAGIIFDIDHAEKLCPVCATPELTAERLALVAHSRGSQQCPICQSFSLPAAAERYHRRIAVEKALG